MRDPKESLKTVKFPSSRKENKGLSHLYFSPSLAWPESSYRPLGPRGKGAGPAPAGRGLACWHSCPSRPRGRAPALGGYLSLRHVRRLPRSPQDLTPHSHYQHWESEQQGEPRRPADLQESSETYSFPTACASRRGDVTGPGVRGGQAAGRGTARPPWLRPSAPAGDTPLSQGSASVVGLWAQSQRGPRAASWHRVAVRTHRAEYDQQSITLSLCVEGAGDGNREEQ